MNRQGAINNFEDSINRTVKNLVQGFVFILLFIVISTPAFAQQAPATSTKAPAKPLAQLDVSPEQKTEKKSGYDSPELAEFSGGLKPKTLPANNLQPAADSVITGQVARHQQDPKPVEQATSSEVKKVTPSNERDTSAAKAEPVYQRSQTNLDATSMLVSLLFVLLVIWVLALMLKKFNMVPGQQSRAIKIVASQHLGAKEKLVVVEINEQQHVLGVTAQNINMITTLEQPIKAPEVTGYDINSPFAAKLAKYFNKKSTAS